MFGHIGEYIFTDLFYFVHVKFCLVPFPIMQTNGKTGNLGNSVLDQSNDLFVCLYNMFKFFVFNSNYSLGQVVISFCLFFFAINNQLLSNSFRVSS